MLALERGGAPEGTCGGIVYLGGGTPMQKAMGFDDTAEDMYAFLRAALGPGDRRGEAARLLRRKSAGYWLAG